MTSVHAVPVFPLPDVVFFSGTALPLHVFEPRYRTMVKDAMAGDRTIAVALLQPGWEKSYEGSPAYHEIATLGRMEDVETTEDGRYYFRLIGLGRVRLGETLRRTPYRLVNAEDCPEIPVDDNDPQCRRAKLELLASQVGLARELSGSERPSMVVDERIPFAAAVNGVCASLPIEPAVRQSLLELDDLMERCRRASSILEEILRRVMELKATSETGPASRDVN